MSPHSIELQFPYPKRDLARRELLLDGRCAKLTMPAIQVIADRAWEFGRLSGAEWSVEDRTSLIHAIELRGVEVLRDSQQLQEWGGFVSEYQEENLTIVLHEGALNRWARGSGHPVELLEHIALAHEFFHHLHTSGALSPEDHVPYPSGKFSAGPARARRSRRLMEACAHGFASMVVD